MVTKLIYPSDLNDGEWQRIKYLLPKGENTGQWLELADAAARLCLLADRLWLLPALERREGLIEGIHERLRAAVRKAQVRTVRPPTAVLDSQSVRTPDQADTRGYDAGRKIKGANAICWWTPSAWCSPCKSPRPAFRTARVR